LIGALALVAWEGRPLLAPEEAKQGVRDIQRKDGIGRLGLSYVRG